MSISKKSTSNNNRMEVQLAVIVREVVVQMTHWVE